MKTFTNSLIVMTCLLIFSCEEDEPDVPQTATIKIINGVQDIGTIEVKDFEGSISVSSPELIRFGRRSRFTLPINNATDLIIVPEEDTLNVVLSEKITLEKAGGIYSLFLYGDTIQVQSFIIEEQFSNYTDSIFGVSFVHAAIDLEAVSVKAIQMDTAGVADTTIVSTSLMFQSATVFTQFEATSGIDNYTFQYLNNKDSVLASFSIDPLRRREKVFRNITLPLIGKAVDSYGQSSLRIFQLDNF